MSLGQKALQLGYGGVSTCSAPANCVYWGKSDCSLARDVVNQLCHGGLHRWGVGPWIRLNCLCLPVPASWEGTVLLDMRLLSGMLCLKGGTLVFQILESQVESALEQSHGKIHEELQYNLAGASSSSLMEWQKYLHHPYWTQWVWEQNVLPLPSSSYYAYYSGTINYACYSGIFHRCQMGLKRTRSTPVGFVPLYKRKARC